jgi:hypothetical protein
MCPWIQRVLFSPHVIGCIVDSEYLMLVYLILDEGNGCSLCLSEHNIVGVVFHIEDLAENIVFEIGNEILKGTISYLCYKKYGNPTLHAGSS